jgi:hypothetical protein
MLVIFTFSDRICFPITTKAWAEAKNGSDLRCTLILIAQCRKRGQLKPGQPQI